VLQSAFPNPSLAIAFPIHEHRLVAVQNQLPLPNDALQPISPLPALVLVVDDEETNRTLLRDPLEAHGYSVAEASSGPEALDKAVSLKPDIILLDLMMPGMDGFGVCERLQADPELRQIPVIFVSAMHETIDKVKALALGGVDYVTKPFRHEEIEARLRTHLELCRQKRKLQENYDKLQHSERLRDSLTHMIVHDLRSPLTTILLAFEVVQKYIPADDTEITNIVKLARSGAFVINDMTRHLLDISRMEAGQMPLDITMWEMTKPIQAMLDRLAVSSEGRALFLNSSRPVSCFCDAELISRVIENLINNAIKFTPKVGKISVSISESETETRVAVTDTGPGIPAKYHRRIFEKFGQVDGRPKKSGTGLGLAFCKLAVEAHGGRIGVESEVGRGSSFWFTLPVRK